MHPEAPLVVEGTGHPSLARAIAAELGVAPAACTVSRFPDGESHVALLEDVRGRRAFVVQPTIKPVGELLVELLLLADALRRAGAASVSAVIPYFAYARQERRTARGEALGGKVIAELVDQGRFASVVAVDLHAPALEGFFATPIEHLSAVSLLAEALRSVPREAVIVAPDLGATKLAREYGRILGRPTVAIQKERLSGSEVAALAVLGDVRGKAPVIVDDMVSTGATICAAARALHEHGARGDVTVVATHGLLVGDARAWMSRAGVTRLVTTDSVPFSQGALKHEIVSLAPSIARAIRWLAR
jgi:ribose-phosphate pyrophosphokinase